jgi:hypothetical protein
MLDYRNAPKLMKALTADVAFLPMARPQSQEAEVQPTLVAVEP